MRIDFSNLLSSAVPKIAESIKLPLLKKALSSLLPGFCGKNALNCKMLLPRLLIPILLMPILLIPKLFIPIMLMPKLLLAMRELLLSPNPEFPFGPAPELVLGPNGFPNPEVLSLMEVGDVEVGARVEGEVGGGGGGGGSRNWPMMYIRRW